MVDMFGWLVLVLSILVADHHVIGSRLAKRQSDIPERSDKTVIVMEFAHNVPEEVFLLGGFTNDNPDQCADMDLPCSIGITHTSRFDSEDDYSSWKVGDNYLDWEGPEPEQGKANGAEAKGTPMVRMTNVSEVLLLTNSKRKTHNSQFWAVELTMDCTNPDQIFEVKALPRFAETTTDIPEKMRKLRDREFDPQRFAGFISRFKSSPTANRDEKGRFVIPGLEDWFNDKLREVVHSAANKPRDVVDTALKSSVAHTAKLSKRATKRIYTGRRRRKRMEQFPCYGEYKFEAPYHPDNHVHIGVCGFANIFLYNTHECEINGIATEV